MKESDKEKLEKYLKRDQKARERQAEVRQKKREAGLKQVQFWINSEHLATAKQTGFGPMVVLVPDKFRQSVPVTAWKTDFKETDAAYCYTLTTEFPKKKRDSEAAPLPADPGAVKA